MDAATGARMAEAEPQATAVGEGSDGHAAGDMLTGPCSMDIDDKESSAQGAQQASKPELNASRTEWVRVISRSFETYGYWLTSLMAASYRTALLPAGACPPLIDHTSHLHVGYPTISHPPITALDRRHPI